MGRRQDGLIGGHMYGYPTRETAYRAGAKAIKTMRAKGFRGLTAKNIRVWDNMGWHTCILTAHFGLYLSPDGKYLLLASPHGHGSGRLGWMVGEGKDSLSLFRQAMARADAEVTTLQKCIADIRAVMPPEKGKPCRKRR